MTELCSLCDSLQELCESHIIPAFAGKWLKETSVTGVLRMGENPNVPRQGIYKFPLLCGSCEQLLGVEDRYFAEQVFRPLHQDKACSIEYNFQLGRFCIAQSFRVLAHADKKFGDLSNLNPGLERLARRGMDTMKALLIKGGRYTSQFSNHVFFLDTIDERSVDENGMPKYLNHYLLRAVDFDVVHGGNRLLVFSKLCKIIVFTFLSPRNPNGMIGTKIGTKGKLIVPQEILLDYIGDFLIDRAVSVDTLQSKLSHTQREKIKQNYLRLRKPGKEYDADAAREADKRLRSRVLARGQLFEHDPDERH